MIALANVTIAHRGMVVLQNVSLTVPKGETLLLTGETGSGKTSLIRALYGDIPAQSGSIIINGQEVNTLPSSKLPALRRTMGLIFQDDKLLDDRTVFDNICFALSIQMHWQQEINTKALEVLAGIGLSHLRSKMPAQLSGGEAQRIGVARALANSPAIILADEPTGDLDPATAAQIFKYIGSYQSSERSLLIATHDVHRAQEAFPNARHLHLTPATA